MAKIPSPVHVVDRASNFEATAVAPASQTADGDSGDIQVPVGSRLAAFLDVTAAAGTSPTLDVVVEAKDPASGKYFEIGAFTQATGVTSEVIWIGGGSDAEFPTAVIRVRWTLGGTAPDFTFSVGLAVGA